MKHTVGKNLTAGTANTLFTVPPGYKAAVELLFVSNLDANNKTTTAFWRHVNGSTTDIYIIDQYPMSSHSYIQFSNGIMVMQAGDSFIVTPEAGATQSALITFELYKEGPVPYVGA